MKIKAIPAQTRKYRLALTHLGLSSPIPYRHDLTDVPIEFSSCLRYSSNVFGVFHQN